MIVRISGAKSSHYSTTKPLSSTVRLSCCLGTKSNLTLNFGWFFVIFFFFFFSVRAVGVFLPLI